MMETLEHNTQTTRAVVSDNIPPEATEAENTLFTSSKLPAPRREDALFREPLLMSVPINSNSIIRGLT